MSTPPSRADGYAIEPNTKATTAFFQAVFSDVHARLSALELTEADYDAVIAAITTQALAIVSANITEEVELQRVVLAQIREAADAIVAEYEAIQANGVPASSVSLAVISGLTAANVQVAVAAIVTALSGKSPLDSPEFTGNPKAPTPTPGDNDTSIATTAFVEAVRAALNTAKANLAGATFTGPVLLDDGDKGTVTSGTTTFDFNAKQNWQITINGAVTFAFSNLPTDGSGEMKIQILFTSGSIAFPSIRWNKGDGTKTTTFADLKITLVAANAYELIVRYVRGQLQGVFG